MSGSCGCENSNCKCAESFSASVVNKGKVPQGAIAKAMMNRAMITQVSIESVIQELENKVNLGLISEDELMKSLKKKFGAEYDIQVFNSRYGGSDCGKCGGSHKGICPDYGEEDEYTKCTDCKWGSRTGSEFHPQNRVIEWCPPCKKENERYWKENAERIRLEKEREEQEERDFQESEKYSREQGDIWEDRYLAESNTGQVKEYMEELPFPDGSNQIELDIYLFKNGKKVLTPVTLGSHYDHYTDFNTLTYYVVAYGDDWKQLIHKKDEKEIRNYFDGWLERMDVPKHKLEFRWDFDDNYDDTDEDNGDVCWLIISGISRQEEKLWQSLWENNSRKTGSCSHDDFEIETIEKDGSDYLLTFKCLDCKKVGSTSAKLPDSGWMS